MPRKRVTASRRSYRRKPAYSTRRAPARRRRSYSRRKSVSMCPCPSKFLSQFALAQIAPFDNRSYGVRVPDDNTAPSSALFTYDEFGITSSATNLAQCTALMPMPKSMATSATPASSSSWTWPAAYAVGLASAKSTAIAAQYQTIRPVAHGVRITCGLNPTTVTGFCHVALYAMSTFGQTTFNLPTTLAQMATCPWYRRYPLAVLTQRPIIVANKFLDQTAFRYADASNTDLLNSTGGEFQVPEQWMVILIAVDGAPVSVTPLTLENLTHYEGTSLFSALQLDRPAELQDNANMQGTSRIIGDSDAVSDETTLGSVVSTAASQFATAASETLLGVANAVGEGVGRYAAGAGSRAMNAGIGYGIAGVNNYINRIPAGNHRIQN